MNMSAPSVRSIYDMPVIGFVDVIDSTGIECWAYRAAAPFQPLRLGLFIDGEFITTCTPSLFRADVKAAGHPTGAVGYHFAIPSFLLDGRPHTVTFRSDDGTPVELAGESLEPQSSWIFILGSHNPETPASRETIVSYVDGARNGAVFGWAVCADAVTGSVKAGLPILVYYGDHMVAQIVADQFRPDVAKVFGYPPNCGFVFVPPADVVAGQSMEFRFIVIPQGKELTNSPVRIDFVSHQQHQALNALMTQADFLFTEIWKLREQIKEMKPRPYYNLHNYHEWAVAYQKALSAAVAARRTALLGSAPLVSILCPVFRPRPADFAAAVESVLAQTYVNWELIIVDDASESEPLTRQLQAFKTADPRLRVSTSAQNGGISDATNKALAQARGDYVAFFDHDDLLVPEAIEVMMEAAIRTGAKILYSDEDKVDNAGRFSEPHFKTDWNYRLLLEQNYVCHLLLVKRSHLISVGPLRSEYDGAQDHDLILRLAEITPEAEIHHVPEILYHWRKTECSTAAASGNKTYAAPAGQRAVTAHLTRRSLPAEVRQNGGRTFYDVRWTHRNAPRVTIIIPYREQIDMTRRCLGALHAVTDYMNYDIILVDNWSVSSASYDFRVEAEALPGVRVLRIEEPFNYSRINNLAVAHTSSEFLLFLNNDVIAEDPLWLRAMVNEALADSRVAVVGSKLFYPNRTIQHAGVVLGVGGVADHTHRGLDADEPGYMGRAICAQEMSAVTAACMLCRRPVFEAVGGFDEQDLKVAFNDVDLCLKIRAAGYRVIWTPRAVLVHHESLSRGSDDRAGQQARFFHENKVMKDRWSSVLSNDGFYNPHFSRTSGILRDLADPMPVAPWSDQSVA